MKTTLVASDPYGFIHMYRRELAHPNLPQIEVEIGGWLVMQVVEDHDGLQDLLADVNDLIDDLRRAHNKIEDLIREHEAKGPAT